jgi:acid phosphatase (class A)
MQSKTEIAFAVVGTVALALASCSERKLPSSGSQAETPKAFAYRYLSDKTMPDSLTVLSPPPAAGTAALSRDEAVRRAALPLRGTPRYALAAADADRDQDATNRAFQCAFGATIDPRATPVLYKLLEKMRIDVRASTYRAKSHYKRLRPWIANTAKVCAESEGLVRDDGSYPSARGAVGWAYALVLAELNPGRRSDIMERGREFGQSRIVCDAEWQSDVDAGRTLAAAVVSRLQRVEQFRSDLRAARQEVAKATSDRSKPQADCAFETQALAMRP